MNDILTDEVMESLNEKKCIRCGTILPKNAEFCGECGVRQTQSGGTIYDDGVESYINASTTHTAPKKKNKALIIGLTIGAIWIALASIGMVMGVREIRKDAAESKNMEIIENLEEIDSILDEKAYKKGNLTSTTYESEFIGIKYTAPDGWVLKSADEFTSTNVEMESLNMIGAHIMVYAEKLPTNNVSEQVYLDITKEQMEKDSGVNATVLDDEKIKIIAGEIYRALVSEVEVVDQNRKVYQSFCFRKIGDYMISIAVTDTSLETHDEIFSHFTKYEADETKSAEE